MTTSSEESAHQATFAGRLLPTKRKISNHNDADFRINFSNIIFILWNEDNLSV